MNDLKQSNVFGDREEDYDESEWDFLDEQSFWLFDSDATAAERLVALKTIKVKQEEYDKIHKSQYTLDQEKRIQAKIKELIEKGVIEPEIDSELQIDNQSIEFTTRYGRSPLHEAVAMRDIRLVKKYLKMGKYLNKVDNNGHTALEMAYYDGYQEALVLFEKYGKRRKTG